MFRDAFPILVTPDLPRALRFYRDLLGFTETYRFPDDRAADGDAGYVGLRLGTSELGLGADPAAADLPPNRRVDLGVYTSDCAAAVEHLRAAGVPVLEEPADQPWGERMARVADPDGNQVVILSR